jgi:molybdopterin-containing oxidoreductase family membrane subunit
MALIGKALTGTRGYWLWLMALVALAAAGVVAWLVQLDTGLAVTGLGRDVSWGLYIAQFTFLVGVAASAVMVVLPCYLHDCHAFARVTILGEFLAVAAVVACGLFIVVDMGQPSRVLNVLLYPTPSSLMFWDMLSLGGYLVINIVIAWATLSAERNEVEPPAWVRPVILLSIPWAISIHTVTAFLYAGLPGRAFWMTALLAPRFLASAFAAGPALLILLALLLRRVAAFDIGNDALRRLAVIVAYATIASLFFLAMEAFTTFYSGIPGHAQHLRYLFLGLDGRGPLVPWMWTSVALTGLAVALLVVPRWTRNSRLLGIAAGAVFAGLWIDKGLGLIVGGLVPNPLDEIVDYSPTALEILITTGIWAAGALLVTVFFKMVIVVRRETQVV